MFETQQVGLPCPKCAHRAEKTIAWIKANDDFLCEACGTHVSMKSEQLLAGIKKAEKGIEKLRKSLCRA